MADPAFDVELERLFADAPAAPDRDAFVARVSAALDRDWGFRRLVIGGLGLAGGLIGGAQVLKFGLVGRLLTIRLPAHAPDAASLGRLPIARTVAQALAVGTSMDVEVLWMSGGLAVLAIGLFVTRTIRDV
jgi:hypothetical protein